MLSFQIQTRPVQLPSWRCLSRRCSRDVESGSELGQSNCLSGAFFPEDAAEMSNLGLNSASPTSYSWRSFSRRCSRDVESGSKLGQANCLLRWYSLCRRCSRGVESGSKLGQSNFLYRALLSEDAAQMSNLDLNSASHQPIASTLCPEDAAKMSKLDLNSASPTAC